MPMLATMRARALLYCLLPVAFVFAMLASPSSAGPLEDGSAAFERGDYETALRLLRAPAEAGNADAQLLLGIMYQDGEGVPKDPAQAAQWIRKAAEQDNATAEFALGVMYLQAMGVPKDEAAAVRWLEKAAMQLPPAQFALARFHEDNGNYAEALKWYRLLAGQGDADSQNDVGHMYETGRGVAQNYAEAAQWYRLAADQGNAEAQNNLGTLYAKGRGVPRDDVQAYMWFALSAAQDNKPAAENRDAARAAMTPGQIAEAQQLVRAFKPKSP
jgi:TPR repeat protein